MTFSQELQPVGLTVFSGPLQPPMQFLWQGRHSPLALYLPSGHSLTQKGPSFVCLQASQESASRPEKINNDFKINTHRLFEEKLRYGVLKIAFHFFIKVRSNKAGLISERFSLSRISFIYVKII